MKVLAVPARVMLTLVLATRLFAADASAQTGAGGRTLTALDYFEIVNLYAAYAHGFDSGAADGAMYAGVFTADGVFLDGSGRGFRGPGALAQLGRGGANSRKGPTNVGHFVTNIVVDPTADGARGRSAVMIGGGGGRGRGAGPAPAPSFGMGGQYWDELRKTPQGWRIQQRMLLRPGVTPQTLPQTQFVDVTPPEPGVSVGAGGAKLTADDYAQMLQLQAREPEPLTNILITPVKGGAVVRAYRLSVDVQGDARSIAPGGIYFKALVKDRGRWHAQESLYAGLGTAVPERAQRYIDGAPIEKSRGEPGPRTTATKAVSAADYAEIRQLYARAALAFDNGADEGRSYAALFTDDAVVGDETGASIRGRAALALAARGDGGKALTETHHYIYNIGVESDRGEIVGRALVVVATLRGMGQPALVSAVGSYRDTLIRTRDGWHFTKRTFTAGLPSPESAPGRP